MIADSRSFLCATIGLVLVAASCQSKYQLVTAQGNKFNRTLHHQTSHWKAADDRDSVFDVSGQQAPDPMEVYLEKTIPLIASDPTDSLGLRSTIFTFLLEHTVKISNIAELIALVGKPCHIHYSDSGSTHLIYSLENKDCKRPGSMLPTFLFDSNSEFVSCWIHFVETDEDFDYWYSSPPFESRDGDAFSPPTFRKH
jgi:hypothetical protein